MKSFKLCFSIIKYNFFIKFKMNRINTSNCNECLGEINSDGKALYENV
jgi:hypothetical protein